jgi:F-type H+-transporting ATPase subunit a
MDTNDVSQAASITQEKTATVLRFIMQEVADSHSLEFFKWHVELPAYLTVHGLMAILAGVILVAVVWTAARRKDPVPRGLSNVVELFVLFIRDHICVPYLGKADGYRMTPLFCSFFFFILTMNLMGLVPVFRAATGDVNVTAALAVAAMFFMVFGAIYRSGFGTFAKSFVPSGVPWPVLIVIVPIEFVGMFIKVFALAIRLFANMLAGHIVILSLLGMVVIFGYVALPVVFMAVGIYLLEVFIALLQAYIFTLLSAIFIGQRYHPAH